MIEKEVCAQHGVVTVGRTDEVWERFYALTVERKLRHPAAVAIAGSAREAQPTRRSTTTNPIPTSAATVQKRRSGPPPSASRPARGPRARQPQSLHS